MDPVSRFLPAGPGGDLDELVALAEQAGRAIERVQAERTDDGDIDRKADGSPVTAADLASHEVLMDGLARLDPTADVLSEESYVKGEAPPDPAWVVDPLDGTKEFIRRNGEYVVNIGWLESGKATFGLVHVPQTRQTFVGAPGVGAWRKDEGGQWQAIQPTPTQALRIVMSRSHRGPHMDAYLGHLHAAGIETEAVPMGSAWKFLAVAEGTADLYPRLGPTMWWDTLAPQAIAEGAGCRVTHLDGRPFRYEGSDLLNPYFVVHGARDDDAIQTGLDAVA